MKITYDPQVDAVDIYTADKAKKAQTRGLDEDIGLDFDARERLLSIKVLAASERLDLDHLLPMGGLMRSLEGCWVALGLSPRSCRYRRSLPRWLGRSDGGSLSPMQP